MRVLNSLWGHILSTPTQNLNSPSYLEPYVRLYNMDVSKNARHFFPIQMSNILFILLLGTAYFHFLFYDNLDVARAVVWLLFFFFPIYFPLIYSLTSFIKGEEDSQLEIDYRHRLITHTQEDKKILFAASQISKCTRVKSIMFPYELDYLQLEIEGGHIVRFSDLIIDIDEFTNLFALSPAIKYKWISCFPSK